MMTPEEIEKFRVRAEKDFEPRVFADGAFKLNYRVHLPETMKEAPLILLMHGAGSIGGDNRSHLFFSSLFCANAWTEWKNAVLLAPQCPAGYTWIDIQGSWKGENYRFTPEPTLPLRAVQKLLKQTAALPGVDRKRIYVGGCSMGGYATWELLVREPELFAAAFPICGGNDPSTAPVAAQTPTMIFHGAEDGTVPPEHSRRMFSALQALGADTGYTEYPGVTHDSWVPALKERAMFAEFFKRRRK